MTTVPAIVPDAIGLAATILLGCCGLPTAYRTTIIGRSIGTPIMTVGMIFLGVVCMFTYLCLRHGWDGWIVANYSIEIVSWGVIVYYHYFPRRPKVPRWRGARFRPGGGNEFDR